MDYKQSVQDFILFIGFSGYLNGPWNVGLFESQVDLASEDTG